VTTPNFLHVFGRALSTTVLCTIENSHTVREIFDF